MRLETVEIKLAPADTRGTVLRRLPDLRGKRVLLLPPPSGTLFKGKLDLLLLQRAAQRAAIQLALVSRDPDIIAYAKELNISCFDSRETSEKSRWKRGRQKAFLPRHHQPSKPQRSEELKAIASRLARHNRQPSRPRVYLERLLVLALLAGVSFATLYALVPSATVQVRLRAQSRAVAVKVTADTRLSGVDLERGMIPAQIARATVETTATMPTTGIRNLEALPARGLATITNLTERALSVPANTILSSAADSSLLFRTVLDVYLPGGIGETANAPFEAMRQFSGVQGKIAAGQINLVIGPLAESISVSNPAPTSGGALRSVQVVSADDRDRLQTIARGQLQSLAYEEIEASLTGSQVIIIESIAIEEERKDWTTFSADVGLMQQELTLTMRAVVAALVIEDRQARQLSLARLRQSAPSGKILLEDSLQYARGPLTSQTAGQSVSFVAEASATLVSQLDKARLLEELAGLPLAEAMSVLRSQPELDAAAEAAIAILPAGFNRMPLLSVRIDLQVRMPA